MQIYFKMGKILTLVTFALFVTFGEYLPMSVCSVLQNWRQQQCVVDTMVTILLRTLPLQGWQMDLQHQQSPPLHYPLSHQTLHYPLSHQTLHYPLSHQTLHPSKFTFLRIQIHTSPRTHTPTVLQYCSTVPTLCRTTVQYPHSAELQYSTHTLQNYSTYSMHTLQYYSTTVQYACIAVL